MKFRLFPTEKEKEEIHLMQDQFRYYYNAILTILEHKYDKKEILSKKKFSNIDLRNLLGSYTYKKTKNGNITIRECIEKEEKSIDVPDWWKGKLHSRVPRGAVCKFTSSINSALSNFRNGNVTKFEMKYRCKKNVTDYLHFEDKQYPKFIDKIKSHFWYRTKDHKRKIFTFDQIKNKKSLEIIYEKETDRYFLHTPVETDFYPSDDLRNDNQVIKNQSKERIVSLDPGVRKFLVGYDPTGSVTFFGEGASTILGNILLEIDKRVSLGLDTRKQQRYIKNLVNELHWKVCSYLIDNYDTILLPDFRVQQMIRGKRLPKMVKRLMMMFSFHSFKEKLKFKCNTYNKNLIIVDESFTSCTCGRCGLKNDVKGKEIFKCSGCKLILDRDVSGSRNILLKNITLRLG
jgi:IS605 OrfB family transposase